MLLLNDFQNTTQNKILHTHTHSSFDPIISQVQLMLIQLFRQL